MYKITVADGREYGPVTAEQLRQWIAEGRINLQTRILPEGATEWRPLSDFPEFAGTIPSAPPPGVTMAPAASPSALAQVNGPAIGLIVTGGLNIALSIARAVMSLLGVGMGALQNMQGDGTQPMFMKMMGTFGLLFGAIGFVGGLLILFGGIKMKKLESYGLVMTASIVAMVPCVSACCIVGLPIGIWAITVLSKPEVKGSFH